MRGMSVSTKFRPQCQLNFIHHVEAGRQNVTWCACILYNDDEYYFISTARKVLDKWLVMYLITITIMSARKRKESDDAKIAALREQHALNPHPSAVQDDAFRIHDFFDPRDLVQVRYEMLRRHRVEGKPVIEASAAFGLSRQAFYKTSTAFGQQGVSGLLPRRRGPRGAHKCSDEVLDFVEQWREGRQQWSALLVADAVKERFGLRINPRSIGRALDRRKKKRQARKETAK
jgi:transposase